MPTWILPAVTMSVQLLTLLGVVLVKFNDLHHLAKTVTAIAEKQELMSKEQSKLAQRTAKIEGRCIERARSRSK